MNISISIQVDVRDFVDFALNPPGLEGARTGGGPNWRELKGSKKRWWIGEPELECMDYLHVATGTFLTQIPRIASINYCIGTYPGKQLIQFSLH